MSTIHMQFAELYGSRDADGRFVRGPYFTKPLSLGVRLGLSREQMKRIAATLGVDTVEGGLNMYPNAEDIADYDVGIRFMSDGNGNRNSVDAGARSLGEDRDERF